MSRLLKILVAGGLVAAAVITYSTTRESEQPYRVVAIFDNAASVFKGVEVRVAGAPVGKVSALGVTKAKKAMLVMQVDDPSVIPFHKDAECTLRPQSLIGELLVDCDPGTADAPALKKNDDAPPTIPVTQTHSPIDVFLALQVLRAPERKRLQLIINELGVGLAGRGDELNRVLRRSNPALTQTSRVLDKLSRQSAEIRQMIVDANGSVGALARRRESLQSFIRNADSVTRVSADRKAELAATIRELPAVLRELEPTLTRADKLADELTPTVRSLRKAAPDTAGFLRELKPFTDEATPAFRRLGEAADVGRPAIAKARPVVNQLADFAVESQPTAKLLAQFTDSFRATGGIEFATRFLFLAAQGTGRFDSISHTLGANLIFDDCVFFAAVPSKNCEARFDVKTNKAGVAKAGIKRQDQQLLDYLVGD